MAGQQDCREGILHIVITGDLQFAAMDERLTVQMQQAVLIAPGLAGRPPEAGRRAPPRRALRQFKMGRGQHADIIRALAAEDAQLGAAVGFEIAIAGEMIRSEVEEGRALGVEGVQALDLVTAQLQGEDGAGPRALDGLQKGRAQIAAGGGWDLGRAQKMGQQVRRGALAVGARDGEDPGSVIPGPQRAMPQLHLADDLDAPGESLRHEGRGAGDAWAEDEPIAGIQQGQRVPSPHALDAADGQIIRIAGRGAGIRENHLAALPRQPTGRGATGSASAHHDGPLRHGASTSSLSKASWTGAIPGGR